MGLKEFAIGRSDVFLVPLNKIVVVPGRNFRLDFGDEDSLAKSIAECGQKVPCTVRQEGDKVEIVDGERRFRAIKTAISKYGAKIQGVKCVAEDRYANDEGRVINMLLANEGKPLEPLEKAEAYKRLVGFGWTLKKIATKMGLSETAIKSCLDLNAAPPEVRKAVRERKISATAGAKVAKASPEKKKAVIDKIEKGEKVGVKDTVQKRTQFSVNELKGIMKSTCFECPQVKQLLESLQA